MAATDELPERFEDVSIERSSLAQLTAKFTAYPASWTLASAPSLEVSDDEEESGSEDDEENPKPRKATILENRAVPSSAYEEFRQFLELGCMGSPIVGYPAVLVVLSTIPSSVRRDSLGVNRLTGSCRS